MKIKTQIACLAILTLAAGIAMAGAECQQHADLMKANCARYGQDHENCIKHNKALQTCRSNVARANSMRPIYKSKTNRR